MYETIEAQATQRRRQPLWAARSVSREEASITYVGGQGQGWRVRTWRAPLSLGSGWGFAWRAVSGARGLHESGIKHCLLCKQSSVQTILSKLHRHLSNCCTIVIRLQTLS